MVLLKVVDLIFIFVVAMVAWSQSGVRQFLPLLDLFVPLVPSDHTALIWVKDLEDLEDGFVFLVCGYVFEGFVVEAVRSADFVGCPGAVVVEVV